MGDAQCMRNTVITKPTFPDTTDNDSRTFLKCKTTMKRVG